uniref:OCA domain-containing protein n=1 Tax=Knipowitschia caucasica TaxID=637954 RepID=A0AAV2J4S3_KNICA
MAEQERNPQYGADVDWDKLRQVLERQRRARRIMDTDFSKRIYQGVRVKHTVKDLLAEKRSRQNSGPRYSALTRPHLSPVPAPKPPGRGDWSV